MITEVQGRALLCRLNRDHLASDAVVQIASLRARMLDVLTREIGAWSVPPIHASLFGSAARGDGDTASDLDILLIRSDDSDVHDQIWERQLYESGQRIGTATGNKVAWFDLTYDEFRRSIDAREPILNDWLREAIPLFGPELRALMRDPS